MYMYYDKKGNLCDEFNTGNLTTKEIHISSGVDIMTPYAIFNKIQELKVKR